MNIEWDKKIAIISYLTILGSIIAMILNSEKKYPFASFHNRQSLGIFVLFFALGYPIGYFDEWMITLGFYLFFFVLWLYGFLGVLQYEKKEIPWFGKLFQKLFKGI